MHKCDLVMTSVTPKEVWKVKKFELFYYCEIIFDLGFSLGNKK